MLAGPGFDPKNMKLQVKYTITECFILHGMEHEQSTPFNEPGKGCGKCMLLIKIRFSDRIGRRVRIKVERRGCRRSLSSSGSNQAREGRLVDALAVRGDEGRDTLR